ncbi:YbaB/EbfC family nucleoid-associated protein [Nonomuraea typhae]|uniref:YbaB/EbfC family nucleoid-associated protein n=1 Tax=Nonomuraea typhae TaxID=2603600 RepID=A0ABW7YZU4_9ACTN
MTEKEESDPGALTDELREAFIGAQGETLALRDRALAVQTTAKSRDGMVAATVGAQGELIRLDLDPRIYRRPDARALAESIIGTVREARAKAVEELTEVFESIAPPEQMAAHLGGDLDSVLEQLAGEQPGKDGSR